MKTVAVVVDGDGVFFFSDGYTGIIELRGERGRLVIEKSCMWEGRARAAEDDVNHAQWRDKPNSVMDTCFADGYVMGGLGRRQLK